MLLRWCYSFGAARHADSPGYVHKKLVYRYCKRPLHVASGFESRLKYICEGTRIRELFVTSNFASSYGSDVIGLDWIGLAT